MISLLGHRLISILLMVKEAKHAMSLSNAVENGLVRHATVGYFMGKTYDFLISVGIDASRLRFRQHAIDEMAHYASDCWDVEIEGSYGWVECVGIAHRGCYDLEAHEKASGKTLRARREYSEPRIIEIDGWTIDGSVAGPAFRADAGQVKSLVEAFDSNVEFPVVVTLDDGRQHTVESKHVKRVQHTVKETGEWFIPHVVEPAFGIDRILWHILDHAFIETEKSGEPYRVCNYRTSSRLSMLQSCRCSKRMVWKPLLKNCINVVVQHQVWFRCMMEVARLVSDMHEQMKLVFRFVSPLIINLLKTEPLRFETVMMVHKREFQLTNSPSYEGRNTFMNRQNL